MASPLSPPPSPRKEPVQRRSRASVEAIHEATIQVLLAQGSESLTTTRVAERAGVSVGTLYQYFPNKQALLYAALGRHLSWVFQELATVVRDCEGQQLRVMLPRLVDAYLDAKLSRLAEAKALNGIASDTASLALLRDSSVQIEGMIENVLATAQDVELEDTGLASKMFALTLSSVSRALIERECDREGANAIGKELARMLVSYLRDRAGPRG
ncbi:TetR/AcrR family transcriptional regulator [Pseudooceanicola sp. CBS1P-1]|uniref:TetR family transcriptional regulator n=1 Tax=Pseudooceanicola albus TaxID=2692189 RepID=A0A6L7GBZ1_9RHOB|nr:MULTISPECIES: TetR/AcrR family transcriptional regulator [Pseudooceanicola]MBT9387057.1 TetR/AcrR family transcriptional regulator [Pseudooceanicola endophyticus]MXN21222.1 TetR family transcriptional regulator [Pseudooceanicola albus]